MIFIENFDLTNCNTFRVPAKAKYYVEIRKESEIAGMVEFITINNLPFLILGEGSNILFVNDFDGLVLAIKTNKIRLENKTRETATVIADAGVRWDDLVDFAVRKNLGGIENLSLIPGTAGAAPVQNIGAYGVEISDTLDFVEGYDFRTFQKVRLSNAECKFGYRQSIFKNELKNKFVITKIGLKLNKNAKPNLSYHALRERFPNEKHTPTIAQVRNAIIEIRKSKLPLPADLPNAGSFFKNPIVKESDYENLKEKLPSLKSFPSGNGYVKLSAAQLIDFIGLKGYRKGDAGVYERHALVLVNYGGATGKEIFELAQYIKGKIFDKFNISLEFEVNVI